MRDITEYIHQICRLKIYRTCAHQKKKRKKKLKKRKREKRKKKKTVCIIAFINLEMLTIEQTNSTYKTKIHS